MIKLAVLGATGRMGTSVCALAADDGRFETVAVLTGSDDPRLGEPYEIGRRRLTVTESTDTPFDCLIDFSVPAGTMTWLDRCGDKGSAMVIGPTGYSDEQTERITAAAEQIAILKAANFSIGINVLLGVVGDLAKRLGDKYDVEIVEYHHNRKVDAPSGSAVELCKSIVEATDRTPDRDVVYGRQGHTGTRPARQIGIHAIRMGDVIGRHEVHLSGPGETITLTHAAHSRDTFAGGALEAAAWICGKPAGFYTMSDMLSGDRS